MPVIKVWLLWGNHSCSTFLCWVSVMSTLEVSVSFQSALRVSYFMPHKKLIVSRATLQESNISAVVCACLAFYFTLNYKQIYIYTSQMYIFSVPSHYLHQYVLPNNNQTNDDQVVWHHIVSLDHYEPKPVNTLRPRQNGHHFADNIVKCIFFNQNMWISD